MRFRSSSVRSVRWRGLALDRAVSVFSICSPVVLMVVSSVRHFSWLKHSR